MSYCIYAKKLRKNIEKSARKIWSVRKNAYLCNPKRKERYFTELQVRKILGAIAQLVEQRTENPCVPSSILGGTTRNPRRCILRGFNFLILLQLRFVRPWGRGRLWLNEKSAFWLSSSRILPYTAAQEKAEDKLTDEAFCFDPLGRRQFKVHLANLLDTNIIQSLLSLIYLSRPPFRRTSWHPTISVKA